MDGNILSSKQRAYLRFFVKPFKVVFYAFLVLFLVANPLPLLTQFKKYTNDFIIKGINEFDITTSATLAFCAVFAVPILLFAVNLILPYPKRKLRERIRVGTKINVDVLQSYKKYHEGNTTTTQYIGFVKIAEWNNGTVERGNTKYRAALTVTRVGKRGFELQISDSEKRFIKFKELYSDRISVKYGDIIKMDIDA